MKIHYISYYINANTFTENLIENEYILNSLNNGYKIIEDTLSTKVAIYYIKKEIPTSKAKLFLLQYVEFKLNSELANLIWKLDIISNKIDEVKNV